AITEFSLLARTGPCNYKAAHAGELESSQIMSTTDTLEYRPSESEPFMNPRQREYFRKKLERWKEEILRESRETLESLQEESQNHPDMADRASSESDRALELRTRDR